MNKIKFGLKNVHYAVATIASDGSATYATPVAFPGAVSLSMEPQGETTPFYADNVVYYTGITNTGYEGDLEMARFSDSFKKDVLGYIEDANGLLIENVNAYPVHFALMFQFEGDEKATRHVLYNCTVARPTTAGSTKNETVEPQTETATVRATSIFVPGLELDISKSETYANTSDGTYAAFFDAVIIPNGPQLSALSITGVSLTPVFAAGTYHYTGTTTSTSNTITATGANSATVEIKANGTAVSSGDSYSWNSGDNSVVVTATKNNLTSYYIVTVTKS